MDSLGVKHSVLVQCIALALTLLLALPTLSSSMAPICCFPEMYEAKLFGVQSLVDMPDGRYGYGYGILNATVKTTYDAVNERTYTHSDTWMWMTVYPLLLHLNETDIVDYKNNVQYRVYYDGSCDEMEAGYQLYRQCIPGNATLMSVGYLGDGYQVKTYLFHDRIYLDPYEITVTVMHSADNDSECVPVRFTNSQAYVFQSDHDVDITYADIVDVTRGVHNTSVFTPPTNCKNETRKSVDALPPRGMFPLPFMDVKRSPSIEKLMKTLQEKTPQPGPIVN